MESSGGGQFLGSRKPAGLQQPAIEPLDALTDVHLGRPSGSRLETPRIGDVVALIAGPPLFHPQVGLLSMQGADQLHELQEADGVSESTAHVEGLTRKGMDVLLREQEGIDQILDEE